MLNIIHRLDRYSAVCECFRCRSKFTVKNIYDAKRSFIGHLCETCKNPISSTNEVTQDFLQKVFHYNEETGDLTHRFTTISGKQGELATYQHSGSYLSVCIGKKQYLAHRVIFLMQTGRWPEQVDHINHNRSDNSWKNLREVIEGQNQQNASKQINSTTGITGVSLHKPTKRYRAYISVNTKQKHLGLFDSIEAAQAARELALQELGYHPNHGK